MSGWSRRRILAAALAAGGLAVGYILRPRRFPLPYRPRADEVAFDAWLRIDLAGVVTVAVPQCEMGQGVTTLLPQIVAHELGADWRQVAVEPAPPAPAYANRALAAEWARLWMPAFPSLADAPDDWITRRWAEDHRFTATAEGLSIEAYEEPLRKAAAAARMLLTEAAAARWDVDPAACTVLQGLVRHGGKTLRFGDLALDAARLDPPGDPLLRAEAPADRSPAGRNLWPRLDLPAKVDGSWRFAGDVRLAGMVHAAIRHAPMGQGSLLSADATRARGLAGFHRLVEGPDWVAALADDWWTAERALDAVAPVFEVVAPAESDAVTAALDKALRDGEGKRIHANGDLATLDAAPLFASRYEAAPALHATVETTAATARLSGGRLELWIGTQAPEAARRAAAAAAGVSPAETVIYPMAAGGSFDRRLECPEAAQVALLAREAGRPVQLTWSRREEHRRGLPRAPMAATIRARLDDEGRVAAWHMRLAAPATMEQLGRRLLGAIPPAEARATSAGAIDPASASGAVSPYSFGASALDLVPADLPLPVAPMRGGADGFTVFAIESMIDELAHRARREPLSWRMAMLGSDPRLAECLQRVAALGEWNGGPPRGLPAGAAYPGSGQGLAAHVMSRGSRQGRIALVASLRRDEAGMKVERMAAAVDIGRVINRDIARQQVEGGLLFGLGLALGGATGYAGGEPLATTLGALSLPRLAEAPEIAIAFLESDAEPFDPGELGVAVAAPAIANALFAATGLRIRRLPLLADEP